MTRTLDFGQIPDEICFFNFQVLGISHIQRRIQNIWDVCQTSKLEIFATEISWRLRSVLGVLQGSEFVSVIICKKEPKNSIDMNFDQIIYSIYRGRLRRLTWSGWNRSGSHLHYDLQIGWPIARKNFISWTFVLRAFLHRWFVEEECTTPSLEISISIYGMKLKFGPVVAFDQRRR